MTYGQLIESIDGIRYSLWKRGFRPYDTVIFMANNHLEMAITYLAVWSIEGCCASLGLNSFPGKTINSFFQVADYLID